MPNLVLSGKSLSAWFCGILGRAVFAAECEQLATVLPNLFGLHLLQLGCEAQNAWLHKSPIHHRVIVTNEPPINNTISVLQSKFEELPFRNDSIDVVLLPHTLEASSSIQPIINEAWRVLSMDGHLIVLGFNPWSLFGIKQLFKHRTSDSPWCRKFHSASKICRLLAPLGGEILTLNYFFFQLPVEEKNTQQKFAWLEFLNQNLLPKVGALYLLIIKKQTISYTLVSTRWRWREVIVNKNLEPTAGRTEHG